MLAYYIFYVSTIAPHFKQMGLTTKMINFKTVLTKDFFENTPFIAGEFTYGKPEVHWWGEPVNLKIGKFCSIANGVKLLLGGNHRIDWITTYPFTGRSLKTYFPEAEGVEGHPTSNGDILIGNDVWIGIDATIMSGTTIGDGAVIAAGSVVTKSVEAYEIVGGNPAKHIGFRFDKETISKLLNIAWWEKDEQWIRSNIRLLMSNDIKALEKCLNNNHYYGDWSPKLKYISKLHFEVVRGCQLRCIGCPNSTISPKVERIAPDFFAKCFSNIDVEEIGLLRLFNFGEPFLHHDLVNILEIIKRAPHKISEVEISTNAQFVNWEQFENAISTGVLTRIAVSCDGDGTPEEYERLRPPSRWKKLIEFLEKASEIKRRRGFQLQLVTRTIVNSRADIDRWNSILIPRGWTPEFRAGMALPQATVSLALNEKIIGNGVCSFLKERDRLYVDSDGTVVPCCAHPRAGALGDLSKNKYSEILASKNREAMASRMDSDRSSMDICNECAF